MVHTCNMYLIFGLVIVSSVMSHAQDNEFSCKKFGFGFFANPETNCSTFHKCFPRKDNVTDEVIVDEEILTCADGNVFDQSRMTCTSPSIAIACRNSSSYYLYNVIRRMLLGSKKDDLDPQITLKTNFSASQLFTKRLVEDDSSLQAKLNFSCLEYPAGFYADVDRECRVFHHCRLLRNESTSKFFIDQTTFMCDGQTVFDQLKRRCVEPARAISCERSSNYYYANVFRPPVRTKPDINQRVNFQMAHDLVSQMAQYIPARLRPQFPNLQRPTPRPQSSRLESDVAQRFNFPMVYDSLSQMAQYIPARLRPQFANVQQPRQGLQTASVTTGAPVLEHRMLSPAENLGHEDNPPEVLHFPSKAVTEYFLNSTPSSIPPCSLHRWTLGCRTSILHDDDVLKNMKLLKMVRIPSPHHLSDGFRVVIVKRTILY